MKICLKENIRRQSKSERINSRIKPRLNQITKEKLVEEPTYDLSPRYDSRQSFYGKARVKVDEPDTENKLYSYGTLVAELKDGKPVVYGTYSATTLRHIKEWLKQLRNIYTMN